MSIASLKPIRPVKPVAPYLGGKSKLASTIIPLINAVPHNAYIEVFIGMGGIFFRRDKQPKAEIINDKNGEVANLFRILQRHYVAFMEMLKWQLTTRKEFERLCDINPETLTDLERAARFLYLLRTGFGGKVGSRSFGTGRVMPGRFDVNKLATILEDAHDRLSGVVVECRDWLDIIDLYDSSEALFYMDPPYYECEKDYGANLFSRDQFTLMAEKLDRIQGKFIISLNSHPDVHRIFERYHIEIVETVYTIAGAAKQKAVEEVVITNFDPAEYKNKDLFADLT